MRRPTSCALAFVCSTTFLGLLTTCARAQSADAYTGKWVGTFDTVNADTSVDPGDAFLNLTQNGGSITGQAGDSPTHLSPIASGTATGDHVRLIIAAGPQKAVTLDLTRSGNLLQGTAIGLPVDPGSHIEVKLARADEAWHTNAAIPHAPDHLFDTIAALDTKLFDAYNTCDLKTLTSLVSEDLEFYHDKTGLAVGRETFINAIRNNICNRVRRTLRPGSLEVHRLDHYGAVEVGEHTFSHPGIDSDQGQAKFITIWHYKDGNWLMTRAISYDHEPLKQ
jgi:ketosteroid isomerase-like protein